MSVAGILSSNLSQTNNNVQDFWQERKADVQQLAAALKSGDLDSAKQAFAALSSLAQDAPFHSVMNFTPFVRPHRALEFLAIGNALESGDLDGARQAFAALKFDLTHPRASQNQGSNLLDIVLHLSGVSTQADNSTSTTTPATQTADSTQTGSNAPADSTPTTPAQGTDAGQTSSAPASGSTASDSSNASTNTQSDNSAPEIVLNLGGANGSSSPQIVLHLGDGSSVSEIDLKLGSASGNGNAAREIVLKFGDQTQSHTLEIDIQA